MGKSEMFASGNHGIFSSSEYYPQVGSYDFRYKSVECGKNDKVVYYAGAAKIVTNIDAQTINSNDYVITKQAYLAKRDSYNFDGGMSNDF